MGAIGDTWGGSWRTSWGNSWGPHGPKGAGSGRSGGKYGRLELVPLDEWLKLHHPEESVEQQIEVVEELAEEIDEAPTVEAARVAVQLEAETRRVDNLVSELRGEAKRVIGLADLLADLADYKKALLEVKRAAEKRVKETRRVIPDLDDEEVLMVIIHHAL